jgi:hypothetical protein
VQGAAEQLVEPGLVGPVPGQVQDLAVCGVRQPRRSGNQLGADGAAAGATVAAAGQRTRSAGEVMGDSGADQPCRVGGEDSRREVGERAVLQLGDDLLDDGVVAVGASAASIDSGESVNTAW